MDIVDARLIALLKISICNALCEESCFDGMTDKDWLQLQTRANKQGVFAVVFNGIEKLPKSFLPSMDVLMDWMGKTIYIKRQYFTQKESSIKLADYLQSHNIDMLVLKGLGLAEYYPESSTREFGDLDIYTFDSHKKLNRLIEEKKTKIEYWNTHDIFDFEGVHVEHHNVFVRNDSKTARKVNRYLEQIVQCDKGRMHGNMYYPIPDFNVVYIIRHTSKHFCGEGVTLRHILDWGLFLQKDGDNVDWTKTVSFLMETKMIIACNTLTRLAEMVTSLDLSRFYIGTVNEEIAQKALDAILCVTIHAEDSYSAPIRLVKKIRRVLSYKWMYDRGLIPDRFWAEFIWNSAKSHILRPSQI